MQAFTVLFDNGYNFLIAKKRLMNRRRGGKTEATHSIPVGAGLYGLPSCPTTANRPPWIASTQLFLDQTGYELAKDLKSLHFTRNGYELSCYRVDDILDICNTINSGLVKRPKNHAIPQNKNILDWELESVLVVPRVEVYNYLAPRMDRDTQARYYYSQHPDTLEHIRMSREIAVALRGFGQA